MKKLNFVAAMAIAAATLTSCGNGAPSASLKNDVDSMTYAIGMAQSQGLVPYIAQMGIDTTKMDMFIKGVKEGAAVGDDKAKEAYLMGLTIGKQVGSQMAPALERQIFGNDSTQSLNIKTLLAGFIAGTLNKGGQFTMEQARTVAEEKMNSVKARLAEKEFGAWKKKNEDWLAANAKKDSIKTLPSGLQYKIIKAGNGPIPKDTSRVKVNYEGKTIEGEVFETTFTKNDPVTLRANQVVKGWTEALQLMPEGSIWELYIPQDLAYGANDKGKIKPFSTLIFKVELVEANAKLQKLGARPMPSKPGPKPAPGKPRK